MFKVSKIADYGVVVLYFMVKHGQNGFVLLSAREIANLSKIPLPTVSKLLKLLAKNHIIEAKRGVLGGYAFLLNPKEISLLRLMEIFDGPQSVTSCLDSETSHPCIIPHTCPQRQSWGFINRAITDLLKNVSLLDLVEKPGMSHVNPRSVD